MTGPAPSLTAETGHAASVYGDTGFNLAHSVEAKLGELGTEWLFIIISIVVALGGMGLAYLFYIKQPSLPDT